MFLLGISMHVLAVFECGVASLTLKVTIISSDFSSTHGDGEGEEDDDDDDDDDDEDVDVGFDDDFGDNLMDSLACSAASGSSGLSEYIVIKRV